MLRVKLEIYQLIQPAPANYIQCQDICVTDITLMTEQRNV